MFMEFATVVDILESKITILFRTRFSLTAKKQLQSNLNVYNELLLCNKISYRHKVQKHSMHYQYNKTNESLDNNTRVRSFVTFLFIGGRALSTCS